MSDPRPDPLAPLDRSWRGAVHELVRQQARRAPDQPAVESPRTSWTYGELARLFGRLAADLRQRGIVPGDVVAICGRQAPELVRAVLSVLEAGGVFLLLDPAHPAPRLARCLRRARPAAWLQVDDGDAPPEELLAAVRELVPGDRCLTLERASICDSSRQDGDAEVAELAVKPNDPACITFTSGSTGEPKGVVGRHGPLTHFLPWQRDAFQLRPGDRYSMLSGVSHDPVQRDIFTALCLGGTLVVPEAGSMDGAAYLATWLARSKITVAHLTPPMARFILQGVTHDAGAFPDLRRLFLLGDRLGRREASAFARQAPGARLVSLYGATETQRAVAFHEVTSPRDAAGDVPLGRGIPDVQLLVVDEANALAEVGKSGQILVRSPHLAAGYLDDADLTADRFGQNPLNPAPDDRVYHSGDRGRYTASGEVEYLGRLDHQLKVRGFRVEPREVAAVLEHSPLVRQAVVLARAEPGGETGLVACVVESAPGDGSSTELRRLAARRLPPQMVPAAFVFVDAMPLTPNGKVDRDELLRLAGQGTERGEQRAEEGEWGSFAGIFADVLGLDAVGPDDDFFDLGGHSLAAARVAVRLRRARKIELSERDIFEAPTPRELARRARTDPYHSEFLVPGSLFSIHKPCPLSHAQQRLWLMQRLRPQSPAYHLPLALRADGWVDEDALFRALNQVLRRHHVLRTRFFQQEGEPVQRVQRQWELKLPVTELKYPWASISQEQSGLFQRQLRQTAARPFDLQRDLMLRAALFRFCDGVDVLLLVTHHIAFDGWSSRIFLTELSRLYEAEVTGRPISLPRLDLQYADLAAWQRAQPRQDPRQKRQLAYWRQRLAGLDPLLELPADRPRPATQTLDGARLNFQLSPHLPQGLQELGRRHGATLFMTLLSAFFLLLWRYTGRRDLPVATPVAGRGREEAEPLIGLFVNTLILRGDLNGDPTFGELLERVREVVLGALANQDVPFDHLVHQLSPRRSQSHAPLAQVMFGLQNFDPGELRLHDLALAPLELGGLSSQFDLSLMLRPGRDGLHGALDYSTDLFDAASMERLAGHYETLLQGIIDQPGAAASRLPLCTAGERRALLAAPPGLAAPGDPAQVPIFRLVEQRAQQVPDAPAVVFRGASTSYRRLDGAANHLARRLMRHGVGRGSYVGLVMERGPELVASLLAVMKSGAAFVPLDSRWPRLRLEQVLQRLGCPVVLAQPEAADPPGQARALRVDLAASAASPEVRVKAEDPIYVFFTSGSTGQPKGAVLPHRGISNRLSWMDHYFGRSSAVASLQTTRHVYDSAVWQFFWPLVNGGKVVIPEDGRELDAAYLCQLIGHHGVTIADFVPSVFNVIAPQVTRSETMRRRLQSLRTLVIGGEEITPETTLELKRWFPDLQVTNLYGPTEASIGCICYSLTGQEQGRIPIGKPIANVRALILDEQRQPCPVGVPGELYLGGACLGLGYLQDEVRSQAAFVQSPLPELAGEKLYRTGDLARLLADGNIDFLGRRDHQIKIRGVRIEPGEIEVALRAHPAVQGAVVTASEHPQRGALLAAYVVLGDGELADLEHDGIQRELVEFLQQRLPRHMVPQALMVLEALPMAPSGKIDRAALPSPVLINSGPGSHTAPRTPNERTVAQLWAKALGVERVDVMTNFFDLGGHSLLLARVHGWLSEALQQEVPITALFQYPTVSALARFLELGSGDELPGDHDLDHQLQGGKGRGDGQRRRKEAGRRQRLLRRRHRDGS